jgi:hypothetical protein
LAKLADAKPQEALSMLRRGWRLFRIAANAAQWVVLCITLGLGLVVTAVVGAVTGMAFPYWLFVLIGVPLLAFAALLAVLVALLKQRCRRLLEQLEVFLAERRLGAPDPGATIFASDPPAVRESRETMRQMRESSYNDSTWQLYRLRFHGRIQRACMELDALGAHPYREPALQSDAEVDTMKRWASAPPTLMHLEHVAKALSVAVERL